MKDLPVIDGKAVITLSSIAEHVLAPDGGEIAPEIEVSKPLTFKGRPLVINGQPVLLMRPRIHRA